MSKWCDNCHRNEIYDEWNSCSKDCPIFGKSYKELAKDIIIMKYNMEELRLMIEQMVKKLENEASNRHMNDLEYGRYTTLIEVLDMIDDMQQ